MFQLPHNIVALSDHRGVQIDVTNSDERGQRWLQELKTKLHVQPKVDERFCKKDASEFAYDVYWSLQNSPHLVVPKYSIPGWGDLPCLKEPEPFPPQGKQSFLGELRPEQRYVFRRCIDAFKPEGGGGIITLPCGKGKTVLALFIACHLKVRTLVIVNKTCLKQQWCEAISTFTNGSCGEIQGKRVDVENKDFVVAMLQSLSGVTKDGEVKYHPSLFADFGLVIVDETHNIATTVFVRALMLAGNQRYTLGLSATPKRRDGAERVYQWFLGPQLYFEKRAPDSRVQLFSLSRPLDQNVQIRINAIEAQVLTKRRRDGGTAILSALVDGEDSIPRNNCIIDLLWATVQNPKRCVVVLSDRINQLSMLYVLFERLNTNGSVHAINYYGKQKPKQIDDDVRVIFATYKMLGEGFDHKALNCLIFASPHSGNKSTLEQTVGRILRKFEEDTPPLLIDLNDEGSATIARWSRIRKIFYDGNRYEYIRSL